MTRGSEAQGRGSTACCPKCKSANRPTACAKVQKWETSFGWRVAAPGGRWRGLQPPRETGNRMIGWGALGRVGTASRHSCPHSRVPGDGPQGIGHSGVGVSALGCRLQDPGAELQAPVPLPSQSGQLANYSTNQPVRGIHFQVPGLGHRVSGTGLRVQVQVRGEIIP